MELKIFENEQFGQVRIAMNENGEPMFCLADLCLVLDLTPSKVAQRLGEDVLSKYPLLTAGGIQQANFVNEDGLYDVILDSRKPEAKKFRKWITSEVLPSIRKNGSYSVQPKLPSYAEALRQLADKVEENERLQIENKEMKPKAEFFDTVADSKTAISMNDVAKVLGIKGMGRNNLFEFLRNEKILMSNNVPFQIYVDRGYFRVIEQKYMKNGEPCMNIKTLVYQKGVDFISKTIKNKRK
jgi:prophage antirepressor-like protein